MSTPFETELRESLVISTEDVAPPPEFGAEVVRLARSARRQRLTMASAGVAGAALLVAILAVVVARPSGTALPVTPSDPPVSPSPNATVPVGGPRLDVLDTANTIHTTTGEKVRIPLSDGRKAESANRVEGGWVIASSAGGSMEVYRTSFLADGGGLREFDPPLRGSRHGFAPDGKTMVAFEHPYLYVFDLPSLTVLHRIDAPGRNGGANMSRLWLSGDLIVVQYLEVGDRIGAFPGVVIWNTVTGAETASPGVQIHDVSADGLTVVLQRWSGTGMDSRPCLSVGALTDRLPSNGDMFCAPPGHSFGYGVSISPDGVWLAVPVSITQFRSRAWLYRTADVRSGTAAPVAYDDALPEVNSQFVSWAAGTQVVLADERLLRVVSCPLGGGECAPVTMPESPRAIVEWPKAIIRVTTS